MFKTVSLDLCSKSALDNLSLSAHAWICWCVPLVTENGRQGRCTPTRTRARPHAHTHMNGATKCKYEQQAHQLLNP